MPTLPAVTGLIRAGNTRKGADSLSNFCLDGLVIKLVKLNSISVLLLHTKEHGLVGIILSKASIW